MGLSIHRVIEAIMILAGVFLAGASWQAGRDKHYYIENQRRIDQVNVKQQQLDVTYGEIMGKLATAKANLDALDAARKERSARCR